MASPTSQDWPVFTKVRTGEVFQCIFFGITIYTVCDALKLFYEHRVKRRAPVYIMMALCQLFMCIGMVSLFLRFMDATGTPLATADNNFVVASFGSLALYVQKALYLVAGMQRSKATLKNEWIKRAMYAVILVYVGVNVWANWLILSTFSMQNQLSHRVGSIPEVVNALAVMSRGVGIESFISCIVTIFLNFTFILPVFQALDVPFAAAMKTMAALGDIQLAVFSSLLAITAVTLLSTVPPPTLVGLSALFMWSQFQIVLFIRVSFESAKAVVKTHTKAGSRLPSVQSGTKSTATTATAATSKATQEMV